MEIVQVRRRTISKFLSLRKNTSGHVVRYNVTRKTTEGSAVLTKLSCGNSSARTKMKHLKHGTLFSMDYKREHSRYGMRGAAAEFAYQHF